MVINHLEKLFVTNDAATVIKELEVEHPAARMLVMAMQRMSQEVSDGVWTRTTESQYMMHDRAVYSNKGDHVMWGGSHVMVT